MGLESVSMGDAVTVSVVRAVQWEILAVIAALAVFGVITFLITHRFKKWDNAFIKGKGVKDNEN